ncbi:MAG TPA: phage holin family protein [Myxococcaceae bacterium]|nr:phage holin family protein [Myxococcaceae bacterium]
MGEPDLSALSTADLIRQALDEAKLLARAEVLHAKQELKDELKAAKRAGIFAGAGVTLAMVGVVLLFVALALALPGADALGTLLVGLVLLAVAGLLAFLAFKSAPKKPLPRTQQRLKQDVQIARGEFA